MATAQELLDAANAAILRILSDGQEVVTVGGRRFTEANLADLRAFRDQLQAEVGAARRPGILDRARHGVVRR
ncbi:MAG: gpW family head-tail joining protein [Thermodesulfobacteriota bacterium]